MAAPTAIAVYGRDAKIAEAIQEKLLPDMDVVHTCLDLTAASTELPALCAGDISAMPSSRLGSNASRPESERRVPLVVFFGAGVPAEEVQQVQTLIADKAGAGTVRFIYITREDAHAAGATGPDPDIIVKLYRSKLAAL